MVPVSGKQRMLWWAAWVASACVLAARATSAVAGSDAGADLILRNGEIRTAEEWAQSLAVRRGVIVGVGADEAVLQHRGAATRIIDLRGATVVPGETQAWIQ